MLQKSGKNKSKLIKMFPIILLSRDLVLAQLTKIQDEPNLKYPSFSNLNNQTQGKSNALCLLPSCHHADEK